MKYIILLLTLVTSPLFTSNSCMDNSEHLARPYDTKEWHAVPSCSCPCDIVKGRHCIECGHLQNARTYDVINPAHISRLSTRGSVTKLPKREIPDNPQNVLRSLAARYLQNK